MKVKPTLVILALLLTTIFSISSVAAQYSRVLTFGADLNREERNKLATELGIRLADTNIPVVDVTNSEERRYLKGLVSEELIGNRAISSALVELLPGGQGITVKTRNVTWVTTDMYSNALVTAGVKDARIIVAAPFPVSGTAALTGIFKAVERATGKSLGDRPKRIANEEMVRTGQLGEKIGKDKATQLIVLVKERIIREHPNTREEIRQIIINIAADLNITLTEDQINDVTVLMEKVNGLNLNIKDISGQLTHYKTTIEDVVKDKPELKSLLQRFLETLNQIIRQVRALILGEG